MMEKDYKTMGNILILCLTKDEPEPTFIYDPSDEPTLEWEKIEMCNRKIYVIAAKGRAAVYLHSRGMLFAYIPFHHKVLDEDIWIWRKFNEEGV